MSTNVDSFTLPHRLENTKMLHQPLHKAATIAAPYPPKPTAPQLVKVHVSKDYMKFNAAHFIAYKGFREKLHGHNYRLARRSGMYYLASANISIPMLWLRT
ncbi:hypothetical protein PHMEG_00013007 [Phytophthora megakarya]|uniref:6-pyruvoyltetrahydropterin synthase n=1 Tax=Phytophthora megakarya TaxID=4795 RepID=A0A225W7S4_9STRA|nr:hypothetical protein PHMEG_00013007 [Phytophthora megakarya]